MKRKISILLSLCLLIFILTAPQIKAREKDHGVWLKEPIFKLINMGDGFFLAKDAKGEKKGVVNAQGQWILPMEFNVIELNFEQNTFWAEKHINNNSGGYERIFMLFDLNGKLLMDSKKSRIDQYREIVYLNPLFDEIFLAQTGSYPAYIDKHGKVLFDNFLPNSNSGSKYYILSPFHKKRAIVSKPEKPEQLLIIGPDFNPLAKVDPSFTRIFNLGFYRDGYAIGYGEKGAGVFDMEGKLVIPPIYDAITEEYYDVYRDNAWIPYYDRHRDNLFQDGYLTAVRDGKVVLLDKKGKETSISKDYFFNKVSGGRILAHKLGFGFLDLKGKEITAFKYDSAGHFTEGLAVVRKGKYGYIDEKGKEVIPLQFFNAYDFSEGLACVQDRINDIYKWGVIDKKGNYVFKPIYDDITQIRSGYLAVKENGKWKIIRHPLKKQEKDKEKKIEKKADKKAEKLDAKAKNPQKNQAAPQKANKKTQSKNEKKK